MASSIRNICIIAHVDHGKTTLVDHILRQAGTYASHESLTERVMDSQDQERERGITILAKNAAFKTTDKNGNTVKVNIMDTPGHADFGGEVERVLGMADGAILLVDAAEGPLPQTRFVLTKAIERKLPVVLFVNKVDRQEVRGSDLMQKCVDKTFDLFVELGASDEQCDFPILFACGRDGICCEKEDQIEDMLENKSKYNLGPLFEKILDFPEPEKIEGAPQLMVSNVVYDDYIGFMALGRVRQGKITKGMPVIRMGVNEKGDPVKEKFQAAKLITFSTGTKQEEVDEITCGDIGLVSGCSSFEIGDTVGTEESEALPRIAVEEPTMRMLFSVNTSPGSGTDGKAIQSRELRERLMREVRNNVALQLENAAEPDQFYLQGRGELQFSIIIETMRREGLEFMVGRPAVLMQQDGEKKLEPFEKLSLDIPEDVSSDVTQMFQQRKGKLVSYEQTSASVESPRVRIEIEIPTRGTIGINSRFKTLTKGSGLISSEALGYQPHSGDIISRKNGCIVADRTGKTTAYALFQVQQRGMLFIGEGEEIYEGMIIGECAKENDINVFASRPKKLTNIRTSSSDGITILQGIKSMSLEQYIEWIDDDDWIEITPSKIRLRKKVLAANQRSVRRK